MSKPIDWRVRYVEVMAELARSQRKVAELEVVVKELKEEVKELQQELREQFHG